LILFLGCALSDSPPGWLDQREPSGPCYEADLIDGVDEASTDELHAIFDCLNRGGNLDPLAALVDSMDASSRTGAAVGADLAQLVNNAPDLQIDVWKLAEAGLEALEDPGGLADTLRGVVELLYGQPWWKLEAGEVDLNSTTALDEGLVRPLLTLGSSSSTVLLDEDLAPLEPLREALASETTLSILHTVGGFVETDDPEVADLLARLPEDLGDAIARSRTPEDDAWGASSGDTFRDTVDHLLFDVCEGEAPLDRFTTPVAAILHDDTTWGELRGVLSRLDESGALERMPAQLAWLAGVDRDGGSLSAGEDSALVVLLEVLRDADQPLECGVLLDLGFSDNLSEDMLIGLSEAGSGATVDAVGLLGDVLDSELTSTLLETAASTGYCTIFDSDFVDDLAALDRLNDVPDLLETLVELLAALHHDDNDTRIPELVDVLSDAHRCGTAWPAQELLRDIGDTPAAADLAGFLPLLLQPQAYVDTADFPTGVPLFDLESLADLLQTLVPDDGSDGPAARIRPLAELNFDTENIWVWTGNFGRLLTEDSRLSELQDALPALADADPRLEDANELASVLLDDGLLEPFLRIAEAPSVNQALAAAGTEASGPLPFAAELVVQGTLEDLLFKIDTVLSWFVHPVDEGDTGG